MSVGSCYGTTACKSWVRFENSLHLPSKNFSEQQLYYLELNLSLKLVLLVFDRECCSLSIPSHEILETHLVDQCCVFTVLVNNPWCWCYLPLMPLNIFYWPDQNCVLKSEFENSIFNIYLLINHYTVCSLKFLSLAIYILNVQAQLENWLCTSMTGNVGFQLRLTEICCWHVEFVL